MSKSAVHTPQAPKPAGPYSQGIEANGFLFTAGFGPQDPGSENAVADTVADQTRQVLRNVQAVLAERQLTLDDCVKTTVHLADLADFDEFNAAYQEFFTAALPRAHHGGLAAGEHPRRDRRRRRPPAALTISLRPLSLDGTAHHPRPGGGALTKRIRSADCLSREGSWTYIMCPAS